MQLTYINDQVPKPVEMDCYRLNFAHFRSFLQNILGLSQLSDRKLEDTLRKQYFEWMKQTDFLETSFSMSEMSYDPGKAVQDFLKSHPEVDQVIFGCGYMTETYYASCFYKTRESPEKHQKALSIDIHAGMRPHVIGDIHDANLWQNIPNERFRQISDHTNGNFLFESPCAIETLKSIVRGLTEDGYLEYGFNFDSNQIELLKKAGFQHIENKVAYKNAPKGN